MNKLNKTVLVFLLIMFLSNFVEAQYNNRNSGISIGVQSLHFDFNIPFWITDKIVLAPSLGLLSTSDNATDISFGGSLRFHLNKKKLSPFLGTRVGTLILLPSKGENLTDLLFGVFWGAEYNFDKNLSIGGELQLNLTSSAKYSNRFGNPDGININTGSYIFVTFYFD